MSDTYQDEAIDGEIVEAAEGAMLRINSAMGMEPSLAVAISQADLDQAITTARQYPRSIQQALNRIIALATLDEETAAEMTFSLPRGRDKVTNKPKAITGESVRLAEIAASQWGNCRADSRVVHVDRGEGYVESEGMCHDLETNYAYRARVRRSIRGAPYKGNPGRIYSEDMIIVTGNAAAAIAFRNAVFKIVPKGIIRTARVAAEKVVRGQERTLGARRDDLLSAFTTMGIPPELVFKMLGLKGAADITLDDLVIARGFYAGIKSGEVTAADLVAQASPTTAPASPSLSDALGKSKPKPAPPAETGKATSDSVIDVSTGSAGEKSGPKPSSTKLDDGSAMDDAASAAKNQRAKEDEQSQGETSQSRNSSDDSPSDEDPGINTLIDDPAHKAIMTMIVQGTATSWLNYKAKVALLMSTQAFKTAHPEHQAAVLEGIYKVIQGLKDPVTPEADPVWFRVWIRGERPSPEAIRKTFSVLCRQSVYTKMDESSKDAVGDDVELFAPE